MQKSNQSRQELPSIDVLQRALLDAIFAGNGTPPDWFPKQLAGLFRTAVQDMRSHATDMSNWHESSEGWVAVWAQRIVQAWEKLEAE